MWGLVYTDRKRLGPWIIAIALASSVGVGGCISPTGKERDTRVSLDVVANAAVLFRGHVGRWPRSQAEMSSPQCAGSSCILLRTIRDGWGKELQILPTGASLRVGSSGPNGRFEADGDDLWLEVLPDGTRRGASLL